MATITIGNLVVVIETGNSAVLFRDAQTVHCSNRPSAQTTYTEQRTHN